MTCVECGKEIGLPAVCPDCDRNLKIDIDNQDGKDDAACVRQAPVRQADQNKMTTTYSVKPFYSQDEPSDYPSGWDVWEETEKSAVIVAPCDSKEEAEAEMKRLQAV